VRLIRKLHHHGLKPRLLQTLRRLALGKQNPLSPAQAPENLRRQPPADHRLPQHHPPGRPHAFIAAKAATIAARASLNPTASGATSSSTSALSTTCTSAAPIF